MVDARTQVLRGSTRKSTWEVRVFGPARVLRSRLRREAGTENKVHSAAPTISNSTSRVPDLMRIGQPPHGAESVARDQELFIRRNHHHADAAAVRGDFAFLAHH
jgi:hypothetical protein